MLNAADKSRIDKLATVKSDEHETTPRKKEASDEGTPRIANKAPTSPRHVRTGLAKELERAFIEASPWSPPAPTPDDDGRDSLPTLASRTNLRPAPPKDNSKLDHAPLKSSIISSALRSPLPAPTRAAPATPRSVPALKMPPSDTGTLINSDTKSSSPRKLTRAISEKVSSVKKSVVALGSPRSEGLHEMFEGVEWQDLPAMDTVPCPALPPLSPSRLPEQCRKRKAESDAEKGNAKKVRFTEQTTAQTLSAPAPETSIAMPPSSSNLIQIDRLARELAQSPETLRSVGQPAVEAAKSTHQASSSKADFPFQRNELAKHAIRSRLAGTPWIRKASGDSMAGRLQGTLDKLMDANPGKLNLKACLCLQQLFGLLPAGAMEFGETFKLALPACFSSAGFTRAEWNDIEAMHRDFDKLNVRSNPSDFASFKSQLGEILAIKNKLLQM